MMLVRLRILLMTDKRIAPITVPVMLPAPPFNAVPPTMTAAIAANSWFTSRADKMLVDAGQNLSLVDGLVFEGEHSPGAGPDMAARLAQR